MKRLLTALLAVTMATTAFVGCSSSTSSGSEAEGTTTETTQTEQVTTGDDLSIALLIPGTLGDKSFYDAAHNGVKMVEEQFNADVKVVEMGFDQTKWAPTVEDMSEQDFDVIITGSWEMSEVLEEVAPLYPEQKYINFDTSVEEPEENVYSMFYKTNELSFMAGTLAALQAEKNGDTKIGFIGGMDNPGINDFLIGYIEGAQNINPDIKVAVSYVGSFTDATKGKEAAIAMYNQGVNLIFQVAGQTGLGVIDAAKELDKFVIGVDSDQAMAFIDSDREKAEHVITSAIKKIDEAIVRAISLELEGALPYGTHEVLGVKEDGVGLAKNEIYLALVDEDIQKVIEEVEMKLSNEELEVGTAFGLTTEQIEEIRASVRP